MQHVNLLSAHSQFTLLTDFARSLFAALGVESVEKRESVNFVDGHYFKGALNDVVFTVALSDESGHEDLPFWIHITGTPQANESLDCFVNRIVRQRAIPEGFRVARMESFGKRGVQRLDYV